MIFSWSMAIRWSVAIFDPARDGPGERQIGVFSSEIDKCDPEWADRESEDQAAHLDSLAYVLKGFGIIHRWQVLRTCCNHGEQQTENAKYNLEF